MPRVLRLRLASLLVAVVAFACGTDTIDLLPPGAGGAAAGAAGSATVGGAAGTAGLGGGGVSSAGSASDTGGAAGLGSSAGRGGAPGCSGFACGGFGNDGGFAGAMGDCNGLFCGPNTKCNQRLGLCLPRCDDALDCAGEGFLCEEHTCAPCFSDDQCKQYGTFQRHVCLEGRCEECKGPSDCPADSPMCILKRCIQCLSDNDCPNFVACDKARGRCQK